MRKNIYKNKYGFSLVETLIAVSILMIAITGPLALVQAGLFSSIHQRNQVTATYLAQEALEYIKNLRDTNSYAHNSGDSSRDWLTGPDPDGALLTVTCALPSGCYVDPHGKLTGGANSFIQMASVSKNLKQPANTSGAFSYSYESAGTVDSPFKRVIKISEPFNTTDEALVSVTITWKDNGLSRSYTLNENIYNYEQ